MPTDADSLLAEVRPLDPHFYADPYAVYERMRRDAPVLWFEPAQCWLVTSYDDVRTVFRRSDAFSVAYGLTFGDSRMARLAYPEGSVDLSAGQLCHAAEARRVLTSSYNTDGAEMLLALDPPRHGQVRRLISKAFTPKVVASMEGWIRSLTDDALQGVERGDTIDFVDQVAVPIPMFVIAALLGVPREDYPMFRRWSDAVMMLANELTPDEQDYVGSQLGEFFAYMHEATERRRERPTDDLMSRLVEAEIDGERLSQATIETLALGLLAAGNETTRNLISGGIRVLAENPDQRARLRDDAELLGSAVEEMLRWVSPITHFARTATQRVELHDQIIEPGDYVVMLIGSANRDEQAWPRAGEFDVGRSPDPMHLAFGFGEHLCLGASLARLEARLVFRHMLDEFGEWELAGDVIPAPSILVNGIESMPIRLG